jgi:hypothetical protein
VHIFRAIISDTSKLTFMEGKLNVNTQLFNKIAGGILLGTGIFFIVASALDMIHGKNGSVPATGFLLIMFGFIFLFPELLRARKDETGMSAIRFLAFMIVSCFVFVTVMFSWDKKTFTDLGLNSTWAYIIAIALGAKTMQTFAEKLSISKEQKETTLLNKKFTALSKNNKSSVPADDMSVNFKS